MKKKLLFCIISGFILAFNITALADCTDMPSMTVQELIESLYQDETNASIKKTALDLALVFTGEQSPERVYPSGLIQIGTYHRDYSGYLNSATELLGFHDLCYTTTEDSYTVFLDRNDNSILMDYQGNKNDLALLYSSISEVKAATAGMPPKNVCRYLQDYIFSKVSYKADVSDNMVKCLKTGLADCGGFTGLFYIYGINCGLKVRCKNGTYQGIGHSWNEVEIDDKKYVVDLSSNSVGKTSCFLLMARENYLAQGVKEWDDTWKS